MIFFTKLLLLIFLISSTPLVVQANVFERWRENTEGFIKDPIGTTTDEWQRTRRRYLDQGLVPPGVAEYFDYLEKQGRGRFKGIPSRLKTILRKHYHNFRLDDVWYAENIDTLHGQGITVDRHIFFTDPIDLYNNPNDMHWLLHELEHVSQYRAHGGKTPFLVKYLVNGGLEMFKNGSVDIHDAIQLERDAENKANRIIDSVWQEWTNRPVYSRVKVRALNKAQRWIGLKFFVKSPGPRKAEGSYWGVYEMKNDQVQKYSLRCMENEKICFGAWSGNSYWGVGKNGDKGCRNCCIKCDGTLYDIPSFRLR